MTMLPARCRKANPPVRVSVSVASLVRRLLRRLTLRLRCFRRFLRGGRLAPAVTAGAVGATHAGRTGRGKRRDCCVSRRCGPARGHRERGPAAVRRHPAEQAPGLARDRVQAVRPAQAGRHRHQGHAGRGRAPVQPSCRARRRRPCATAPGGKVRTQYLRVGPGRQRCAAPAARRPGPVAPAGSTAAAEPASAAPGCRRAASCSAGAAVRPRQASGCRPRPSCPAGSCTRWAVSARRDHAHVAGGLGERGGGLRLQHVALQARPSAVPAPDWSRARGPAGRTAPRRRWTTTASRPRPAPSAPITSTTKGTRAASVRGLSSTFSTRMTSRRNSRSRNGTRTTLGALALRALARAFA